MASSDVKNLRQRDRLQNLLVTLVDIATAIRHHVDQQEY